MIYLPSELEWLGWIVGMEWPDGNEDQMWNLAQDWRTAADGLRGLLDEVGDARYATLASYPDGKGSEKMAEAFDLLSGKTDADDSTSIPDLAKYFDSIGESAQDTGTEIEYTKLMFYSSLGLLAAELIAAWVFPPTAPAVEAAAIALTRVAVRIIGARAVAAIARFAAKMAGSALAKFLLRHVAIDFTLGTVQEIGIQQYQVSKGSRKEINWTQVGVTAISSAAGGAAAGPFGGWLGNNLARRGLDGIGGAGLSSIGAGLAGAGAGFVAATGAQFGFDVAQHGWDQAVENLSNTQWDWRMLTAGASNGAMSGMNHHAAHNFWNSRGGDGSSDPPAPPRAPDVDPPTPGLDPATGPTGEDPSTRPTTEGQDPSTRPTTDGQDPSTRPTTDGQDPSTRPTNDGENNRAGDPAADEPTRGEDRTRPGAHDTNDLRGAPQTSESNAPRASMPDPTTNPALTPAAPTAAGPTTTPTAAAPTAAAPSHSAPSSTPASHSPSSPASSAPQSSAPRADAPANPGGSTDSRAGMDGSSAHPDAESSRADVPESAGPSADNPSDPSAESPRAGLSDDAAPPAAEVSAAPSDAPPTHTTDPSTHDAFTPVSADAPHPTSTPFTTPDASPANSDTQTSLDHSKDSAPATTPAAAPMSPSAATPTPAAAPAPTTSPTSTTSPSPASTTSPASTATPGDHRAPAAPLRPDLGPAPRPDAAPLADVTSRADVAPGAGDPSRSDADTTPRANTAPDAGESPRADADSTPRADLAPTRDDGPHADATSDAGVPRTDSDPGARPDSALIADSGPRVDSDATARHDVADTLPADSRPGADSRVAESAAARRDPGSRADDQSEPSQPGDASTDGPRPDNVIPFPVDASAPPQRDGRERPAPIAARRSGGDHSAEAPGPRPENGGAARDPEAQAAHDAAVNSALYGDDGPPVDDWSNRTPEQISDVLRTVHGITTFGFDSNVHPEVLREFARAVDDIVTRYGAIDLREVSIQGMDDPDNYAEAWSARGADGSIVTERLVLNADWMTTPERFANAVAEDEAAGDLVPNSSARPVFSTVAHELGHALDFAGYLDARAQALDALVDHYEATYNIQDWTDAENARFQEWLHQLSDYGFDDNGTFDATEALAEAFTDVELNGEDASEPAQVLYDLLTGIADDATSTRDPEVPRPEVLDAGDESPKRGRNPGADDSTGRPDGDDSTGKPAADQPGSDAPADRPGADDPANKPESEDSAGESDADASAVPPNPDATPTQEIQPPTTAEAIDRANALIAESESRLDDMQRRLDDGFAALDRLVERGLDAASRGEEPNLADAMDRAGDVLDESVNRMDELARRIDDGLAAIREAIDAGFARTPETPGQERNSDGSFQRPEADAPADRRNDDGSWQRPDAEAPGDRRADDGSWQQRPEAKTPVAERNPDGSWQRPGDPPGMLREPDGTWRPDTRNPDGSWQSPVSDTTRTDIPISDATRPDLPAADVTRPDIPANATRPDIPSTPTRPDLPTPEPTRADATRPDLPAHATRPDLADATRTDITRQNTLPLDMRPEIPTAPLPARPEPAGLADRLRRLRDELLDFLRQHAQILRHPSGNFNDAFGSSFAWEGLTVLAGGTARLDSEDSLIRVVKEVIELFKKRGRVAEFLRGIKADRADDFEIPVNEDGTPNRFWENEADPELAGQVDIPERLRQHWEYLDSRLPESRQPEVTQDLLDPRERAQRRVDMVDELEDLARRYVAENERVPFSDKLPLDGEGRVTEDPGQRFLRELLGPDRVTFLDNQGVNNGNESPDPGGPLGDEYREAGQRRRELVEDLGILADQFDITFADLVDDLEGTVARLRAEALLEQLRVESTYGSPPTRLDETPPFGTPLPPAAGPHPSPETRTDTTNPDGIDPWATRPGDSDPAATRPDGFDPSATRPDGWDPGVTRPDGVDPNATRPDGWDPSVTRLDGVDPNATRPDGLDPSVTRPDGVDPNQTRPDATAGKPVADVSAVPPNPDATTTQEIQPPTTAEAIERANALIAESESRLDDMQRRLDDGFAALDRLVERGLDAPARGEEPNLADAVDRAGDVLDDAVRRLDELQRRIDDGLGAISDAIDAGFARTPESPGGERNPDGSFQHPDPSRVDGAAPLDRSDSETPGDRLSEDGSRQRPDSEPPVAERNPDGSWRRPGDPPGMLRDADGKWRPDVRNPDGSWRSSGPETTRTDIPRSDSTRTDTTRPDIPVAEQTRPDLAATTRPDLAAVTRPDLAATTRPDFAGTTRPDAASSTRTDITRQQTLPLDVRPELPTAPLPVRPDAPSLLERLRQIRDEIRDLLRDHANILRHPSGSNNDSFGASFAWEGLTALFGGRAQLDSPDALIRIIKEIVDLYKGRGRIWEFWRGVKANRADDFTIPVNEDGTQNRYWETEADPDLLAQVEVPERLRQNWDWLDARLPDTPPADVTQDLLDPRERAQRRVDAVDELEALARRYVAENERVPFSDQLPLDAAGRVTEDVGQRYLRELLGPDAVTFLDNQGVNNGNERPSLDGPLGDEYRAAGQRRRELVEDLGILADQFDITFADLVGDLEGTIARLRAEALLEQLRVESSYGSPPTRLDTTRPFGTPLPHAAAETRTDATTSDVPGPRETRPDGVDPNATRPDGVDSPTTRTDGFDPAATRPDGFDPNETRSDNAAPQTTRPDTADPNATRPDAIDPNRTRSDGTDSSVTRPDGIDLNATRLDSADSSVTRPVGVDPKATRSIGLEPPRRQASDDDPDGPEFFDGSDWGSDPNPAGDSPMPNHADPAPHPDVVHADATDTQPGHDPSNDTVPDADWSPRPDDDWSRRDRVEIADRLTEILSDRRTDGVPIQVIGFDNANVPTEVMREYARAIEEMLTRYPTVDLRGVSIEPIADDKVYAEAAPARDDSGRWYTERLVLNERFATFPVEFQSSLARDEARGGMVPGSGARPVYSTILHEFGHALDFEGQMHARERAFDALADHFEATRGGMDVDAFHAWITELSGYSFREDGSFYATEALAEAFADVESNGDNASEAAKVLYWSLLDAAADQSPNPRLHTDGVHDSATRPDTEQISRSEASPRPDPGSPARPDSAAAARPDAVDPRPDANPRPNPDPDPVDTRPGADERPRDTPDPARRESMPDRPNDRLEPAGPPPERPDADRVTPEQSVLRDLAYGSDSTNDSWVQHRPDPQLLNVAETLARTDDGRAVLESLREADVTLRLIDSDGGPQGDSFDPVARELLIDIHGRDELAQAAAIAAASVHVDAALNAPESVDASPRTAAESFARQADVLSALREEGLETRSPLLDVAGVEFEELVRRTYLDARDAALRDALAADLPEPDARRLAREAGIDALLADPLFSGPETADRPAGLATRYDDLPSHRAESPLPNPEIDPRTLRDAAAASEALRTAAQGYDPGTPISRWALDTLNRNGVDLRFSDDPGAQVTESADGSPQRGESTGYQPATNTVVLSHSSSLADNVAELVRAASLLESMAGADVPRERNALSRDEYIRTMLTRQAESLALAFEHLRAAEAASPGDRARVPDPLERTFREARDRALRTARGAYAGNNAITPRMLEAAAYRAGVRAIAPVLLSDGPRVAGNDLGTHYGAEWDRAHGIQPGSEAPAGLRPDHDSRRTHELRAEDYALDIEQLRGLRDLGLPIPVGPAERVYTDAYDRALHRSNADDPQRVAANAGRDALRRYLDRTGLRDAEVLFDVVRAYGENGEARWGQPDSDHPVRDVGEPGDRQPARPVAEQPRLSEAESRALSRLASDTELRRHSHMPGHRLSDHVVQLTNSSRAEARLVVFATDGEHMRVLRELGEADNRYAEALWDGRRQLDYRLVTPDGAGGVRVEHLSPDAAEGSMRRPTLDEAVGEMLTRYLGYRAEGGTELGFREWMAQLGAGSFRTSWVEDGSGTRRQVPVELMDDFLTHGNRTAHREDGITHPHPAAVARDLMTRQLPMPPVQRPGEELDAHRRSDPDRYHDFSFTAGPFELRLWLERDGQGGWRIPPPTGQGGISDALARRFGHLTGPSPEALGARITRTLFDGSAPLGPEEAAERPRNLWQRMTDRLTGRGAEPTSADGLDALRPNRADLPDEPAQRRATPEEPSARDQLDPTRSEASDRQVPDRSQADPANRSDADSIDRSSADDSARDWSPRPDDEWSTRDRGQIADQLAEILSAGRPDDVEIQILGFDNPDVPTEVLREFARAIDDMLRLHPDVEVNALAIGDLPARTYAETQAGGRDNRWLTDAIVLNEHFATNPDEFARSVARSVEVGGLVPGSDTRPIYTTIIHEFAHALDFGGQMRARFDAFDLLLDEYISRRGTDAGFEDWVYDGLSRYSFDREGMFDMPEALAEAFTDVRLNGRDASEPAQILHRILLDAFDAGRVARDNPAPGNADAPARPAENENSDSTRTHSETTDSAVRPGFNPDGTLQPPEPVSPPARPGFNPDGTLQPPDPASPPVRPGFNPDGTLQPPRQAFGDDGAQPDSGRQDSADNGSTTPRQPDEDTAELLPVTPEPGSEGWFERMQQEQADWLARMEAKLLDWLAIFDQLETGSDTTPPETSAAGDGQPPNDGPPTRQAADDEDPDAWLDRIWREHDAWLARMWREHDAWLARMDADRAEWLASFDLPESTRNNPDAPPSTREPASTVPGEPPDAGPPLRPASDPDDPDAWFDRERASQADWLARMATQRAEWLHRMADTCTPGSPEEWSARFRADAATWDAQIAADRADWLWDMAGGRPEVAATPESGGPNPADPVTTPEQSTTPDPSTVSDPATTRPEATTRNPATIPDGYTPTVPDLPVAQAPGDPATTLGDPDPNYTPTQPDIPGIHEAETQPIPLGEQPTGPEITPAPVNPMLASPALRALAEHLLQPGVRGAPPARTPEQQAYVDRLAHTPGLRQALAGHPDALATFREIAEMARARGLFGDPENGVPPTPMGPDDFRPLTADERYAGEQYWRTEADPDQLAAIEAEIRAAGLEDRLARAAEAEDAASRPPLPATEPTPALPQSSAPGPAHPSNPAPATTRPDNPATSRPAPPATTRPDNPATTRPANPATTRPDDPAATRPDETTTRVENPAATRGDDPSTTRPDDPAVTRPDNLSTTRAESPAATRGDDPAATLPVNPAVTRPDNLATTRAETPAPPRGDDSSTTRPDNQTVTRPDDASTTRVENPAATRGDDQSTTRPDNPASATRPDNPGPLTRPDAPTRSEPRILSLPELRAEIAARLNLSEADLTPARMSELAGDLQYRNVLRAGAIEALADAIRRHDATDDPAHRAEHARTRDDWARLLNVDPDALRTDSASVLDELRAETYRRAADVADLLAITHYTPDPADGTRIVLEADGERIHVRITDGPDGRVVEQVPRPGLPAEPGTGSAVERRPRPGFFRRQWEKLKAGFPVFTPKYPSGSGQDGQVQVQLAVELGHLLDNGVLMGLENGFNPIRLWKEIATQWQVRERLPLLNRLTARIAAISPDALPMRTRDGDLYEPWFTEADPVLRAEIEESLRLAGMPVGEEQLENVPQHENLAERPEIPEPPAHTWSPDLPQPLADAVDARDAALTDLIRMAREQGIDLTGADAASLRRAVDEATYELMRRAGAIEGLRDAATRYNTEDGRVPYTREINFSDNDPLGRYLREVRAANEAILADERAEAARARARTPLEADYLEYRARRPRPTFLDAVGVNNGGEPARDFDNAEEELSSERSGRLFEAALMRDQIRDERSNWAQLLAVDLDALSPDNLAHTIGDMRVDVRDSADRLGAFADAVDNFLRLDDTARDQAIQLGEGTARDWVDANGGVMVDRGVGILPGEPGGPQRLVVIRGDSDHDVRLADALAANPHLGEMLNRGELQLDYRIVGFDDQGAVTVIDVVPPQVRFHDVEADGDRLPLTVLRDGVEPWRIVQGTLPEPDAPVRTEPDTAPAAPRDPDVVRAERNEVAARLSVYQMDLGPEYLRDTIDALRHDNALRAAQIEGMADFIRTSDAIDNFHDLDRHLANLANRFGLDPTELTARNLAEAMADPDVRAVRRLQAIEDLLNYAKVLRDGTDSAAVLAARDELARRLGVQPEDLYASKHVKDPVSGEIVGYRPDPKSVKPASLLRAINDLLYRSGDRPELLAALADYIDTLGRLDPYREAMRYDPATDPRAADGELPIHDRDAPALLRALMSESIGEPPISDNPSQAASVWSRLLGVDLSDDAAVVDIYTKRMVDLHELLSPRQFAHVLNTLRDGDIQAAHDRYADSAREGQRLLTPEQLAEVVQRLRDARYSDVYDLYRDGKIDKHERLEPAKFAEQIETLRREIREREADIDLLERLAAEHGALTDPPEPTAPPRDSRDVATDLAQARRDLDQARAELDYTRDRLPLRQDRPLTDADLTRERLPGTVDYLNTRSEDEIGAPAVADQRVLDLRDAAEQHHRAEDRVARLEDAMREALLREAGPDDSPADAWRRELDSARAELEAALDELPGNSTMTPDRAAEMIERLNRIPLDQTDIWTDELLAVRDAADRYTQAQDFLARAEADELAASRAAETPADTARRELSTARLDLLAAEAQRDAALIGRPESAADLTREWVTATREALSTNDPRTLTPADRARLDLADAAARQHDAADRVARWETEQSRLASQAAAATDTPHTAAERSREAAESALNDAITNFRRNTGLNVAPSDLTPTLLNTTLDDLASQTIRGITPHSFDSFTTLRAAAESLHRATAFADWVAANLPDPATPTPPETTTTPGRAEPATDRDPAEVAPTRDPAEVGPTRDPVETMTSERDNSENTEATDQGTTTPESFDPSNKPGSDDDPDTGDSGPTPAKPGGPTAPPTTPASSAPLPTPEPPTRPVPQTPGPVADPASHPTTPPPPAYPPRPVVPPVPSAPPRPVGPPMPTNPPKPAHPPMPSEPPRPAYPPMPSEPPRPAYPPMPSEPPRPAYPP
ncbi:WXG100-like domain-containing protein, partial [Nocardia sp. NPDC055321]